MIWRTSLKDKNRSEQSETMRQPSNNDRKIEPKRFKISVLKKFKLYKTITIEKKLRICAGRLNGKRDKSAWVIEPYRYRCSTKSFRCRRRSASDAKAKTSKGDSKNLTDNKKLFRGRRFSGIRMLRKHLRYKWKRRKLLKIKNQMKRKDTWRCLSIAKKCRMLKSWSNKDIRCRKIRYCRAIY